MFQEQIELLAQIEDQEILGACPWDNLTGEELLSLASKDARIWVGGLKRNVREHVIENREIQDAESWVESQEQEEAVASKERRSEYYRSFIGEYDSPVTDSQASLADRDRSAGGWSDITEGGDEVAFLDAYRVSTNGLFWSFRFAKNRAAARQQNTTAIQEWIARQTNKVALRAAQVKFEKKVRRNWLRYKAYGSGGMYWNKQQVAQIRAAFKAALG